MTDLPMPTVAVVMTRVVGAPRDEVFRAWTDPAQLVQWWGPTGFSCPDAVVDLRPGGRYRLVMAAPGAPTMVVSGVYREVEPPERLVYSWGWESGPAVGDPESVVTVEFREHGDGTEIILTHGGFPQGFDVSNYDGGWQAGIAKLATLLAGRR